MKKNLKTSFLIIQILIFLYFLYRKNFSLIIICFFMLIFSMYLLVKWNNKKNMKEKMDIRSGIIVDVILFCMIILTIRVGQIQLLDSEEHRASVTKQVYSKIVERGRRGEIQDSTGKKLAYNKIVYDVVINPKIFVDALRSNIILKGLIEKKYINGQYKSLLLTLRKLGSDNKRYRVLAKGINENEKIEIEEFLAKRYRQLEINPQLIFFEEREERVYFRKEQYSNLIGNVGYRDEDEKEGVYGIELAYENYLKGDTKLLEIQSMKNIKNRRIALPISDAKAKVNLDGMNIQLTIDDELHYILNDEIEKQFDKSGALEAYGLIMDPNNGKVLATSGMSTNSENQLTQIFQSKIEPGSIFKPIVVAAALNEGKVSEKTIFDVGDGKIVRYDSTIRESSRSLKGRLSVSEIIMKSSNVGMVLLGEKFTDEEFDDYLDKFKFYEKTGIDFPYEQSSMGTPVEQWHGIKKNNISFGQGIAVTPIQIATAFSSVINGGKMYKPYLVEKITDKDGLVVRRNLPVLKSNVLKPETSNRMKKILEKSVQEGTAKKAYVENYRLGAKTGTAEYSEKGKYVKNEYLSSVIGFFPVEEPKYVILVSFFKPQGKTIYDKFGGSVAAPVLCEIVKRIAKLKNIQPENIESIKNSETDKIKVQNNEKILSVMPKLIGMSAIEVMDIFKNNNIEIEITGTGTVINQDVAPKTKLEDVKKIKIKLE